GVALTLIPGPRLEPGFDDVLPLSTPPQWFPCVRLLGSYLTGSRPACSGTLTTGTLNPSRFRRLGTWSCNPIPSDLPSSLTQHGGSGHSGSRPFPPSWRTVVGVAAASVPAPFQFLVPVVQEQVRQQW